jgi:thiosulfate/3-mercaptopyruvate sulfurtransferase
MVVSKQQCDSCHFHTVQPAVKSFQELRGLYSSKGIPGADGIIAYCRIGERSSHTWFVLKYLLGYKEVRNYDGSSTEWGG